VASRHAPFLRPLLDDSGGSQSAILAMLSCRVSRGKPALDLYVVFPNVTQRRHHVRNIRALIADDGSGPALSLAKAGTTMAS
jgi:hypothetical protein